MTFGEVKVNALNLIQQETIAGTEIPGTYNNQQDYLNKIPGLVNAALMDIATTAKYIPAEVTLGELYYEESAGSRIYELPDDMWQRRGSGLLVPRQTYWHDPHYGFDRFSRYRLVGRTKLILQHPLPDDTILEYYRYPDRIPILSKTDRNGNYYSPEQYAEMERKRDAIELDNAPETHELIPYYVAANVVIYDDPFLYASFYNTYQAKKAELHDLPEIEMRATDDVLFAPGDMYFWGD